MRVRTAYNVTIAPCGDEYFSEVEDYSVVVIGGSAGPGAVTGNSTIYPNPFTNYLNIQLTNWETDEVEIALYDVSGALKLTQKVSNSTGYIDLSGIRSKGVYILRIYNGSTVETHNVIRK